MKGLTVALAALVLVGCATPYQAEGVRGGFTDTKIGPNVFRISMSGNGFTSFSKAEDMALLRAADVALRNGFSHFVVIDGSFRTRLTSADTTLISSPVSSKTIAAFRRDPSGSESGGRFVYVAADVYDSLAPKFDAPPRSQIEVKTETAKAEDPQTAAQKEWRATINRFYDNERATTGGIDYRKNDTLMVLLDATVKELANDPRNNDKSMMWFLVEADRLLKARLKLN